MMKKSKLVTICSTENSDWSKEYSKFSYTGYSRSENKHVNVTLPTYPENIMYYEHYTGKDELGAARLSFMLLGVSPENGTLFHGFSEYTNVSTVDFSRNFMNVEAIFEIISQLPSCRDVRIFLDKDNIRFSPVDSRYEVDSPISHFKPYVSKTVKSLRIENTGDPADPDPRLSYPTRFNTILSLAEYYFPNLDSVRITIFGGGTMYDTVYQFIQRKRLFGNHKITLNEQIVKCEPLARSRFSRATPQSQQWSASASPMSMCPKEDYLPPIPIPIPPILPESTVPKNLTGPSYLAELSELAFKQQNESSSLNQISHPSEVTIKVEADSDVEIIEEVLAEPKPETFQYSENCESNGDHIEATPTDMKRMKMDTNGTDKNSTIRNDQESESIIDDDGKKSESQNSLTAIGSSYDVWEADSEEELQPQPTRRKSLPNPDLNNIDVTKINIQNPQNIRSILKQVESNDRRQKDFDQNNFQDRSESETQESQMEFIEGVNYLRRPKPKEKYRST